jgi:hypothetical protein
MSVIMRNSRIEPEELKSYVEDIVLEALRDGTISPSAMLECIYYCVEPDLLATIRAIASLGSAERLMVMSYAKKLADETVVVN